VGIIGDTRSSPTWANSAITRGFFDATWPDLLPANGGATSITRLGDILNYGKEYLMSQVGVAQSAGSVDQNAADTDVILYHVFGDPTLEMWTDYPYNFVLGGHFDYTIVSTRTLTIRYAVDNTIITVLQGGNPVGRGSVVNGQVTLTAVDKIDPQQRLEVSASYANAISRQLRPVRATARIKPDQGGELSDAESRFAIHLPAGATQQELDLFYATQISPTLPLANNLAALRSFALAAEDETGQAVNQLAKAYTMELGYTAAEITQARVDKQSLHCVYLDEAEKAWKPVASTVDAANHQVTCQADHFTEFALVAGKTPPADGGT
jgi:hypothetical protein